MVAVVNDFDENRSEGSLADESQFESMKPKVTLQIKMILLMIMVNIIKKINIKIMNQIIPHQMK